VTALIPSKDQQEMRRITHVAISYNGKLYSIPAPYRHPHLVRCIRRLNNERTAKGPSFQGFLDSDSNYLDRQTAWKLAVTNGQFIDDGVFRGEKLFSEDVWKNNPPFETPVDEMLKDVQVRDCTLTTAHKPTVDPDDC